jgi:hypothetical protein
LSETSTWVESEFWSSSVTVRFTVYATGEPLPVVKVCCGLACVLVGVPSPKFHR